MRSAARSRTRSATGSSRTTCSRCARRSRGRVSGAARRGGGALRARGGRCGAGPLHGKRGGGCTSQACSRGDRRVLRLGTGRHRGLRHDGEARELLVRAALDRGTRRLGAPLEPGDALVVGDTPRDVSAARAHGVPVVGVATGRYGAGSCVARVRTGCSPPGRGGAGAPRLDRGRTDSGGGVVTPSPPRACQARPRLARGPSRPPGRPRRRSHLPRAHRRCSRRRTAAADLFADAEADADRRLLMPGPPPAAPQPGSSTCSCTGPTRGPRTFACCSCGRRSRQGAGSRGRRRPRAGAAPGRVSCPAPLGHRRERRGQGVLGADGFEPVERLRAGDTLHEKLL